MRLPAPQPGTLNKKSTLSSGFFIPPWPGWYEALLVLNIIPWQHNFICYKLVFHYLYILQSQKDGKFYTGISSDLRQRVKEHNSGENTSTSYRRPLKLIYYEAYLLKQDAEAREKYLKTSMGRRVIRKQLSHYLVK